MRNLDSRETFPLSSPLLSVWSLLVCSLSSLMEVWEIQFLLGLVTSWPVSPWGLSKMHALRWRLMDRTIWGSVFKVMEEKETEFDSGEML